MSPRRPSAVALLVAGALLALALVAAPLHSPARPHPAAAAEGGVTIGVVGDFGMANAAETEVARLVDSWGPDGTGPDAVIGTGDAYYSNAGGSGLGKYDLSIGRDWCRYLAGAYKGSRCPSGGTATTNRFWTATGNHDYSDAGIDLFTGYLAYPGNERWFHVRIGPVDLFVLDSSAALWQAGEMTAQKEWLQAAAAASTAPWKVVVLHHPPYSSSTAHGSSTALRWPYAAWGIDLVLAGHDHTYERIERDGIDYIVDGLGGGAIYGLGTPIEGSVARYDGDHGALQLVVTDTTIDGRFVSVDGVVRDTFRIAHATSGGSGGSGGGEGPGAGGSPSPTQSPSPTPTGTPSLPVPLRPASFTKALPKPGSLLDGGSVTLSWRRSARALRYRVCVSSLPGRCTGAWRTTTATRLRVTLPRGATRYWQVRAVGRTGLLTTSNAGRWWRVSTR